MEKNLRQVVLALIVNEFGDILTGYSPKENCHKIPQGRIEEGESAFDALRRGLKKRFDVDIDEKDIELRISNAADYIYPGEIQFYVEDEKIGINYTIFKIRYRKGMVFIPQTEEFGHLSWVEPIKFLTHFDTRHRKEAYQRAMKAAKLY